MPKYRVNATVAGGKYLGEFEADTPEEAAEKAMDANGHVSLCYHCSRECGDLECEDPVAELVEE